MGTRKRQYEAGGTGSSVADRALREHKGKLKVVSKRRRHEREEKTELAQQGSKRELSRDRVVGKPDSTVGTLTDATRFSRYAKGLQPNRR